MGLKLNCPLALLFKSSKSFSFLSTFSPFQNYSTTQNSNFARKFNFPKQAEISESSLINSSNCFSYKDSFASNISENSVSTSNTNSSLTINYYPSSTSDSTIHTFPNCDSSSSLNIYNENIFLKQIEKRSIRFRNSWGFSSIFSSNVLCESTNFKPTSQPNNFQFSNLASFSTTSDFESNQNYKLLPPPTTPKYAQEVYNSEVLKHLQSEDNQNIDIIPSTIDLHSSNLTLYQYATCPFCNKVKSCLDMHNLSYKIVEVDPLFKKELKFSPDYKKVPQLRIEPTTSETQQNDIILKDSKRIVHAIMKHEKTITKTSQEMKEIEYAWLAWTDKWLVQLIVINIYRTLSEAFDTFRYLLTYPNFSFIEKYLGAITGTFVMWIVASKKKKKFNIVDERNELYNAFNDFVNSIGNNKFLGGNSPNEVDIAVFGILCSIKQMKAEADIFENSKIGNWHKRMSEFVFK